MARAFKILPKNYLMDWGEFEAWAAGTTTIPTGWVAASSPTCFLEATNKKWGNYSLGLIGGSAISVSGVYQTVPDGSDYAGRTFKLGVWAKSADSNPYIEIWDGVASRTAHVSDSNAFVFCTTSAMKLDYNATELRINLMAAVNGTVYFDGAVLCEGEDLFTNLTDTNVFISDWKPSIGIKLDQYEIARREGSFIPEYHLQRNTVKAAGTVAGSDVASCRTHFDSILKSLMSWQKNEKRNLYLYDDRVLEVFLSSFDWDYFNAMSMVKFNMQFSAPDSTTRYINKYRTQQIIAATITEFNLTYNGNAESKPVISFIADQAVAISTCAFENLTTGESMAYTGTVPVNVALDIDSNTATVMNSGVDKISQFTGDFPKLVRGVNYLRFAGSNCTIRIDYFERWY
jgi:phage-related protein